MSKSPSESKFPSKLKQYIDQLFELIGTISDPPLSAEQIEKIQAHIAKPCLNEFEKPFEFSSIQECFGQRFDCLQNSRNKHFLFRGFQALMRGLKEDSPFFLRGTIKNNPWAKLFYLHYAKEVGFRQQLINLIKRDTKAPYDFSDLKNSFIQMEPIFEYILKHDNFQKNKFQSEIFSSVTPVTIPIKTGSSPPKKSSSVTRSFIRIFCFPVLAPYHKIDFKNSGQKENIDELRKLFTPVKAHLPPPENKPASSPSSPYPTRKKSLSHSPRTPRSPGLTRTLSPRSPAPGTGATSLRKNSLSSSSDTSSPRFSPRISPTVGGQTFFPSPPSSDLTTRKRSLSDIQVKDEKTQCQEFIGELNQITKMGIPVSSTLTTHPFNTFTPDLSERASFETAFELALKEDKQKNNRELEDHSQKIFSYCQIVFNTFDTGDFFLNHYTKFNFCAELLYVQFAKQVGFYEALLQLNPSAEIEESKKFTEAFEKMRSVFALALKHPTFSLDTDLDESEKVKKIAGVLCFPIISRRSLLARSESRRSLHTSSESHLFPIPEGSCETSPKDSKDSPEQTTRVVGQGEFTEFNTTKSSESLEKKSSVSEQKEKLPVWEQPVVLEQFKTLLPLVPEAAYERFEKSQLHPLPRTDSSSSMGSSSPASSPSIETRTFTPDPVTNPPPNPVVHIDTPTPYFRTLGDSQGQTDASPLALGTRSIESKEPEHPPTPVTNSEPGAENSAPTPPDNSQATFVGSGPSESKLASSPPTSPTDNPQFNAPGEGLTTPLLTVDTGSDEIQIGFFKKHKKALYLTMSAELAIGFSILALATYSHFAGQNLLLHPVPMIDLPTYQAALCLAGAIAVMSVVYLAGCKVRETYCAPADEISSPK
ncbi:MAG: hypothetical protein QM752_00610 [Gammaproteobacteria bacterium]